VTSENAPEDFLDDLVVGYSRAANEAVADLCRHTINVPDLRPAGVSDTVANLAALAAALPQAFAQVSRALEKAQREQLLEMDSMTGETDVDMAAGVAKLHLEEARELAVELHKRLDSAHQSTAHIISNGFRR
jgi:hypothetical protein